MRKLWQFTLAVSLLLPLVGRAATRDTFHQQGLIVTSSGTPLEGLHELTFRFFEASTGGTAVWEETVVASFSGGFYSVELGDEEPLPDDFFETAEDLYLSLSIDGGDELAPRFSITSTPMSRVAETAITALSVDDSIVLPRVFIDGFGEVINTSGEWVGPAVSSMLGDSINSTEIVDGTIVNADISSSAAIAWSKVSKTGAVASDVGAATSTHSHTAGDVGAASASHSHAATDITSGTLSDSRLSSNVSLIGQTIESTEITDGTITTSDISATAAITDAQINNNLTISGGTIDSSAIGSTTPSTGVFTTLSASNQAGVTLNPFGTDPGNTGEIRWNELAAGGSNYIGLKAPDSVASNLIWTLPSADGSSGQILTTNGSGVFSWASDANAGGDIMGVTAGSGLSGGGTSGDVTLSATLGTSIDLTSEVTGVLPDANVADNLTISSLGSVAAGAFTGELSDSQVSDTITVGSSGSVADAALSANVTKLGSTIESSEITNDTIVNADVNSSAAISGSKISPNFGSQDVETTGDIEASGGYKIMTGPFYDKDVSSGIDEDWELQIDGNVFNDFPLPWAGSVVGVSLTCDRDITAGSISAEPRVDGVGTGLTATVDTSGKTDTTTQAKDADTFSAGAILTCRGTSASLTPTNADCFCYIWVEM